MKGILISDGCRERSYPRPLYTCEGTGLTVLRISPGSQASAFLTVAIQLVIGSLESPLRAVIPPYG